MKVTRVDGRVNPPCDPLWSGLKLLQWQAAVVEHDTGLSVTVKEEASEGFSVQVGPVWSGPHRSVDNVWTYLNGVDTGVRAGMHLLEERGMPDLREYETTPITEDSL